MRPETNSSERLIAMLLRDVLATSSFESIADLKDALKRRCAKLRIRPAVGDIGRALDLVGSNRPLVSEPTAPPTRPRPHVVQDRTTPGVPLQDIAATFGPLPIRVMTTARSAPRVLTLPRNWLARSCQQTWRDSSGAYWPVPTAPTRLKWRHPLHWRLRAFVFERDRFSCCDCRLVALPSTIDPTGRECPTIVEDPLQYLLIDHVISLKNGGSNHPDNLRTTCNVCNLRKVGQFDTPLAEALAMGALFAETV